MAGNTRNVDLEQVVFGETFSEMRDTKIRLKDSPMRKAIDILEELRGALQQEGRDHGKSKD